MVARTLNSVSATIIVLGGFLLSPYLLLLSEVSGNITLDLENFRWALKNTLFQALGSGALSVILGIWGGMGLLWLSRKFGVRRYHLLERMVLLPSLLPSLFVIVSCLSIIEPFPFGKIGIILLHTIINVGLASVLFMRLCREKLGGLGALSLVEGASRWQFFRAGILGYLRADIFYLFLFFFATAAVSLNVPLMVGGSSGTTLEVLIYESLVIENHWGEALSLSLLQMLLVGLVSFLSRPQNEVLNVRKEQGILQLVESRWGLIVPAVALGMVLMPPLFSLPRGLLQLKALEFQWSQVLWPIIHSIGISLGVGLFIFSLSLGACLGFEKRGWRRFLLWYLPPGPILVGFSFYILGRWVSLGSALQIMLGLSLVYFASLYRLSLVSSLTALGRQIEVAQVLGSSPRQIFTRLIFPQMLGPLMFVCGLSSMWACGDFALSKVLVSEDLHLALIVKTLAGNYRLDAAQVLMFVLYLIAIGCYLFWWRLGNVIRRKFDS